jgi:hypothetical protein
MLLPPTSQSISRQWGLDDLYSSTLVGASHTEGHDMGAALSLFTGLDEHDREPDEPSGPGIADIWPDFERFKLTRGRQKSTLANYRTALNSLAEWSNTRFNKPSVPAASLTLRELEAFQEFVGNDGTREKQLRANHHLKQIKSIWDWGARRHLLPEPPLFPEPFEATSQADKTAFTDEQLGKLYDACQAAKWPRGLGLPAATYWRGLMAFEAFYGIDVQSLVPYEPSKVETALKLDAFSFESLSPYAAMDVENEFGWFSLVRRKTKRKKPVPVYYPLNRVTRSVVDRLWPPLLDRSCPPAVQLFPFPRTNKLLRETWKAIVTAAGISPRHDGEFHMIHFRNTAANRYSSDIANYLLGHSSRGNNAITEQHYRTALPQAVAEVNAAAYPACFDREAK